MSANPSLQKMEEMWILRLGLGIKINLMVRVRANWVFCSLGLGKDVGAPIVFELCINLSSK